MGHVLEACAVLTDEQFRQPFEIGQGSLWKSLVHMHAAEYVWLEAMRGNPRGLLPGDVAGKLPGNQEGDGAIVSFDELLIRWRSLDQDWEGYLEGLSEAALDETVFRQSSKGLFGTKRRDALLHVCTHAHYTLAQTVNMLRHLGVAPLPDPMLITMAREEV